jgi:hypothetical protein
MPVCDSPRPASGVGRSDAIVGGQSEIVRDQSPIAFGRCDIIVGRRGIVFGWCAAVPPVRAFFSATHADDSLPMRSALTR